MSRMGGGYAEIEKCKKGNWISMMLKLRIALLTATVASVAALAFSTSVVTRPAHADSSVSLSPGSFSLDPNGGSADFTASMSYSSWTDTTVNLSYSSSGPAFTGPSSVTIPAGQTAAVA